MSIGYEVTSKEVTIEPGRAVVRTLVPCPAGKKVIGAGWRQTKIPLERLGLWESGPSDDQKGWVFSVVNEGSKRVTVRLYVFFADVLAVTPSTSTDDLKITVAAGPDHTVQLKVIGDNGLDITNVSDFTSSDPTKASVIATSGLVTGVAVAPVNEVQTVTITGTPTGGFFALTFGGNTTVPIAHDAAAAAVESALVALPTIGTGNVAAAGGPGPGAPFTVTFQGALAQTDVSEMTAAHTFTGGAAPNVSVTTTTPGVPPVKIIASHLPPGQSTALTGSAIITVVS